jgi:ABC-2 type transport system permease protein
VTSHRANYLRVLATFAKNSLIRDMTFRWNFIIQTFSSMVWMLMNLGFYLLIYRFTDDIAGWGKFQFFVFIATTMIVNSLVQALFMPNVDEFSEMIRTGGLDFALLKPIDTQFLISLQRINWSAFGNLGVGIALLLYSVAHFEPGTVTLVGILLYPVYVLLGVAILYAVMITLAATSIWLGRNQSLYDFWFYITNFSRYPMHIYDGRWGTPLRHVFTFVIPILVVINVPAWLMAQPFQQDDDKYWFLWGLAGFAVLATAACLWGSRWVFRRSLLAYRSASS